MLGPFGIMSLAIASAAGPETSQRVCAGSLAAGYIKVNDEWNPTTCGNPTSIIYNVWIIDRYDNKPVGSTMKACNGSASTGLGGGQHRMESDDVRKTNQYLAQHYDD